MKFTKMHGIGNDYVYVDCVTTPWEQITDKTPDKTPEEVAIQVSDRHFGIGSDGLILIKTSEVADFFMDMYNLDGSRGSMCGNGIRCVAKYVYDHQLTDKTTITIETPAGIKIIDLTVEDGKAVLIKVDMGAPVLTSNNDEVALWDGEQILVGEAADQAQLSIWEDLEVSGADGWNDTMPASVKTIGISMGNPHTIMFYENMAQAPVLTLGPVMEKMSRFANRTNVEFIVVHDRQHLEMRVWERGSGETMACGTGACASAIAAMLAGYVDDTVTVRLLGGDLQIHWNRENGQVEMTGPATEVFSGEIVL